MTELDNQQYNNIINLTPEQIIYNLLQKEPEEPCSNLLLLSASENTGEDNEYIFEVLATMLLEAFDIYYGGLDKANMMIFSVDHVKSVIPWFKSIGFTISIHEADSEPDYYCRVIIKNQKYKSFFTKNKINKNYHFLKNSTQNVYNDNIKDIVMLFSINNKLYVINFESII